MLKKRIGALILTTMVLGTAVTPVNAKTPVYVDVPVTKTIINETFNNCTPNTTGGSTELSQIDGTDETVSVKKYAEYGNNVKPYEITQDNAIKLYTIEGAYLNIANSNGTTSVKKGDVIKVSFKVKVNSNDNGADGIVVNLNNRKKTAADFNAEGQMGHFVFKEGNDNEYRKPGYPITGDTSYDGRILNLFLAQKRYSLSSGWDGWKYDAQTLSGNNWNYVIITINTKDAAYDNKQTLRADVNYVDDNNEKVETYFKGLYDADYRGTDDETYDVFDSIDSLQLDTISPSGRNSNVTFDDIKVTIDTTENRLTKMESDFNKTVINESLTNLGNDTTFKNGESTETPVNGSETVSTRTIFKWGASTAKATADGLEVNYNNGARLRIKNPNGTTALKDGNIVKVSLKAKNVNKPDALKDSRIMLTFGGRQIHGQNSVRETGKVSNFIPKEGTLRQGSILCKYPFDNENDKNLDGRLACINMARGKYALTNKMDDDYNGPEQKMSTTDWNDITITVNTKDAAYEGKQTLRVDVSYTEDGDVKTSYIKGIFDADYNGTDDTNTDILTEIGDLIITSEAGGYECLNVNDGADYYSAMFKDAKVSVLSTGFETWGTATMVDSVDGALSDTFIPGGLLNVKAQAFSENALLIVANYNSDDVLTSTKVVPLTDGNVLNAENIDTTGAEYIKLFLWNDAINMSPCIESKTLTKESGNSHTIH